MRIFIGHDRRENEAYEVCKYSILQNSKIFYQDIIKLTSENIPEYCRYWGEPQSTDFTFTRFWVPYLSNFKGFSLFCDCDFLFLKDIKKIMEHVDKDKAVSVVQHSPYTPHTEVKMDGVSQHKSYRKNWASLMVFNNEHPVNQVLTPRYLNNHKPGLDFHHLKWVPDKYLGSLPIEWNVLDSYVVVKDPAAIHYTDGGPWFGPEYSNTTYSNLWIEYEERMLNAS